MLEWKRSLTGMGRDRLSLRCNAFVASCSVAVSATYSMRRSLFAKQHLTTLRFEPSKRTHMNAEIVIAFANDMVSNGCRVKVQECIPRRLHTSAKVS